MGIRDLPTKNNLIKLKNFIKQSKEGHNLLEQKKMILQNENLKTNFKKGGHYGNH